MNTKTVLMGSAIVLALALFVAPLALSESASAWSSSSVTQTQTASQSSTIVGKFNIFSGLNFLSQFQSNN